MTVSRLLHPGPFLILGFGNVIAGVLLLKRPGRAAGLTSQGLFVVLALGLAGATGTTA